MSRRKTYVSDGVFWGLTGAVMAGIMGGAIGFVFAQLYGAGWLAGGALGAVIFIIAGAILSATLTSTNLPPPNTLKAPTAPPGGAYPMPQTRTRPTYGPAPKPAAEPAKVAEVAPAPLEAAPVAEAAPATSIAEVGQAAGEAVGKAVYGASAAVTSAAEAARAAIADLVAPGPDPVRPATLEGPRGGVPDDLKKIKGVGPKIEGMLNAQGFYHFEQIANWGPAELAWVDANLDGFNGRATRDDWVGQAKHLAGGGTTEFSERVDRGEVY